MAKWPYNTLRWQTLRIAKLRLNPLCEYCPPGSERAATQVDHKKAIRDGGAPFDLDNLASVCQSCHSSKTASGERLKGVNEDGTPRDPNHEWNTQ
jgi:5-methylcytosine-specific restriction endonuclease McrA